MENQCWRVKLYQLELDGIWNDQGTGFVSCEQIVSDDTTDTSSYAGYLMVRKEENNAILLQSSIQYEDAYERQGESIIMWRENCFDSGNEIDYALSFEKTAGCYAIWDAINDVQAIPYKISGASSSTIKDGGIEERVGSQHYADQGSGGEWHGMTDDKREEVCLSYAMTSFGSESISTAPSLLMPELASSYIGLPSVSLEFLDEIKDKLLSAYPSQKEVYASFIREREGEYFQKLLQLSEDLLVTEDISPCRTIAEIIRGIVYLNDHETLELIIKNHSTFSRVAGAMELDPLLKERGRYKEVLLRSPRGPQCIVNNNFGGGSDDDDEDVGVEEKESSALCKGDAERSKGRAADLVTKLFRARLLRDNMIRPLPDESGATALNNFLCSLQSALCDQLFNDTVYLQKILNLIESPVQNAASVWTQNMMLKDVEEELKDDSKKASVNVCSYNIEDLTKMMSGLCFLRELFFMSRQLSIEKRGELYSNCLHKLRVPFFSALRSTLCMRGGETLSSPISQSAKGADPQHPHYLASSIRVMAAEILSSVTHVCPSFLRQTIVEGAVPTPPPYCGAATASSPPLSSFPQEREVGCHENDNCLLFVIIERICCDEESSVTEHLGDTVKVLLDPERMDNVEKDRFVALFYDYYVHWLLVPFAHDATSPDEICCIVPPCPRTESNVKGLPSCGNANYNQVVTDVMVIDSKGGQQQNECEDPLALTHTLPPSPDHRQQHATVPPPVTQASPTAALAVLSRKQFSAVASSRRFLCEIFSQCANSHYYRMKFFIVRNNVIPRILKLLKSNHKHMHIGAVKFIRAILSVKDEFYHKHIVKYDILKPMFELFQKICSKDNLITSAIVEVIDFIRTERVVTLIFYVVEKYKSMFTLCLGESGGSEHAHEGGKRPPRPYRQILLHVEVFQKFLHTYEQLRDQDSIAINPEQGSHLRSGPGQGNGEYEVGVTRKLLNKNLSEIESEEAYFFDIDDEDDGNIDDNDCNGTGGYGPFLQTIPSPPIAICNTTSEMKGHKRSYFDDLESMRSGDRGVERMYCEKNIQRKSERKADPLKLISDIYGDDDIDEAEGDDDGDYVLCTANKKTEIIISDIVHNRNDDTRFSYSPPPPDLPPLQSKFKQDGDEDDKNSEDNAIEQRSNIFFERKLYSRGAASMQIAGRRGGGSSRLERKKESTSKLTTEEALPGSDRSSGGIKFSIKKKSRYF